MSNNKKRKLKQNIKKIYNFCDLKIMQKKVRNKG